MVFVLIYIPPLLIFLKYAKKKGHTYYFLIFISIIYLITSLFTQNLIPFILVLANLRYMNEEEESRIQDSPSLKKSVEVQNDPFVGSSFLEVSTKETLANQLPGDYTKYHFKLREFKFGRAIKYASLSYGITFIISILTYLILSILKVNSQQQEIVDVLEGLSLQGFLLMVPMVILFAPVLEEYVFRYLLFEKVLRKKVGIYSAAVLSSAIFALAHFNTGAFLTIFFIGLVNCYLIKKHGFWYAVFNHFVFNYVSASALLLGKLQSFLS